MSKEINIPKGWKIIKLGKVFKVSSGKGLKVNMLQGGGHAVYGGNGINGYHSDYFIESPTLIIGRVGVKCGVTHITKPKSWVTDNALIVSPIISDFDVKFFQLKLEYENLNKLSVSTAQPVISGSKIYEYEILLPPLKEQQAIVFKIEELLSDLENGKQQLQIAQQQLKIYRQSLLKWAFEGKLTNKNVKDGELPVGWKWIQISELCNVVRGGSPRPAGDPRFYDGNIPFLKVRDITKDNNTYLTTFEYTIKEAGLHKTRQIKPNTLLLSNSGATLGVPKICMIDATMNDGIAAFLDLDQGSNLYLYYFWISKTRELRNINMGAAQPNLNTDIIKNYLVPYCSHKEQQLIVDELESKLTVCDKIEETISQSLLHTESLRQSILKRAFEGKLVVQKANC